MDFSKIDPIDQAAVPAGASATRTPAQTPAIVAQRRDLVSAMRIVNDGSLLGPDNELTYVIDRETRLPAFRVVDRASHQVIAQLPPETVLRLAEELRGGGTDTATTPGQPQ